MRRTLALFVPLLLALSTAKAQIPRTISYQGMAATTSGQPISDGSHTIIVSLYDLPTGGTLLYSEAHAVQTVGGIFSISIGSINGGISPSLLFNKPMWLAVSVDGTAELHPRTPLAAAPYALYSEGAATLAPDAPGVVRSVNGQSGALTFVGAGGATVTQNGSTITIGASSGGGGGSAGVQGVQNTDGALAIQNPNGPSVTVNLANGGVTSAKLAPGVIPTELPPSGPAGGDLTGLYPNPQIAAGAVGTAELAARAVTPAKIDTAGATSGAVLTFNGRSVVWGAASGGSGSGWNLSGNAATSAGTNFIGTLDNQAFEVHVNNTASIADDSLGAGRVMRWAPAPSSPILVGGYHNNVAPAGNAGNVIVGGGLKGGVQQMTGTTTFSIIGGGAGNAMANSFASTIGGGLLNYASAYGGVVGGGQGNYVSAAYGTVGGGGYNAVYGADGTVGGGVQNVVDSSDGLVAGGIQNRAQGTRAAVMSGLQNTARGSYSVVIGGYIDTTFGAFSIIGGGYANRTDSSFGAIGGGYFNRTGPTATVAGGVANYAQGAYSSIAGGGFNRANGNSAFIGGGSYDSSFANYTVIGGGYANRIDSSFGAIGGGYLNRVDSSLGAISGGYLNRAGVAASVAGGGGNIARGSHSAIGGGYGNWVSGFGGTISGGLADSAFSSYGSVGGGLLNVIGANGPYGVIGGGSYNRVNGSSGTVGGGDSNTATGTRSTVPGGFKLTASSDYSTAMGSYATAANAGSFVYGDNSTTTPISSNATNQFVVRAQRIWLGTTNTVTATAGRYLETSTGAYLSSGGTWTNSSDRNRKTEVQAIDRRKVLEAVTAMPVAAWRYRDDAEEVRHIGPMAQDFHAAFGLNGPDSTHIATVDADGVALAAIGGLNDVVREQQRTIETLQERNRALEAQQLELLRRLERLEAREEK